MELEQDIELAIRERGLREMLVREEARVRQAVHRRTVRRWALGGSGTLAVAAILVLAVILVPTIKTMHQYSTQYVASIETEAFRGGDGMSMKLCEAMVKMKRGQWVEAERIADTLLEQTADSEDEEDIDIHQSAEWIKALCLMHDGKIFSARKLLKRIAAGDSYYSPLAEELLR